MSSPPSFQGDDSASPYVTFHEGRYWFRDARGFWSWYDAGSGAWVPLDPRALDFPAYASSSTTYSSPDEEASALDGMDGGDSGLRLSRASTREPMASGTDGQPVHQDQYVYDYPSHISARRDLVDEQRNEGSVRNPGPAPNGSISPSSTFANPGSWFSISGDSTPSPDNPSSSFRVAPRSPPSDGNRDLTEEYVHQQAHTGATARDPNGGRSSISVVDQYLAGPGPSQHRRQPSIRQSSARSSSVNEPGTRSRRRAGRR